MRAPLFPAPLRAVRCAVLCAALCAFALLGWLLLAPAPVAAASTYYVGSTGDSTTTTNCTIAANTTCTLRGAISVATSGSDTILFNSSGSGTIRLTSGTLTLTHSVTIDGTGHSVIVDGGCTANCGTASAMGGVTVFTVNSGVTATLNNLTIQHGNTTSGSGGGIYNNGGTVALTNSTLSGNSATNGSGGGICNNSYSNNSGLVTLTNSTLAGNFAKYGGGGIYNPSGSTVTLTNSTLSGNSTPANGGGIYNAYGGTVTLTNTIVAGNTFTMGGSSPDLYGPFTSIGHNLISDTNGSSGIMGGSRGDIVNNTPLLGTLTNNGGPTQTIPLRTGSPAIGGVPHANCTLTTDGRGLPRPASGACAIGAFEPQNNTAYTVGNLNDSDSAGTLAACQSATNTTCRLRDALALAPSAYDTETITFNSTGQGLIRLTNGTLTVAGNVTITGPTSGAGVIVDGGCTFSGGVCTSGTGVGVFAVNPGVTVGISNLTIQHGNDFYGNGGGVFNFGGTVTLTNSTLSGNAGSCIFNTNGGTLTLTNSTLSGNSSSYAGGGIYNFMGKVTLTNSTITGNSATNGGGGGILGGMVTLTNTIVAGNSVSNGGSGPDVKGTVMSGGHNLIGITNGSSGITNGTNGDQAGMIAAPLNPMLGTLSSNGGTTPTIPLMPGSPAIAHGDPAVCNATTDIAPVGGKDQRGVTRPSSLCAIGAFEPLLSAIAPASGGIGGGATVTLTGTGFVTGATVSVGGVSCTNVQVVSSTTLRCTTGAHAAGTGDVVVTVNSQTGTLTGGYTYGVITPQPTPTHAPATTTGAPHATAATHPAVGPAGTKPNPQPAAHP